MSDGPYVLKGRLRYRFWAAPGQGQSLDELILQLVSLGNAILKVEDGRVLVAELYE